MGNTFQGEAHHPSGQAATVLIVDDEPSIQKLVEFNMQRAGFTTILESDGVSAYERLKRHANEIDIVILDVMLPGLDGVELCKRLRHEGFRVPIILLTAKDDEIDRVVGLEIGADDYVTKPFSPRELVARTRAVLRRMELPGDKVDPVNAHDEVLAVGEISMNLSRHEVTFRGNLLSFTPKEFELLQYLMENKERVLSRDQLLDHVWGYLSYGDTRIVDVHVSHLREKLEQDPKNPRYLRTVRGVGYKISEGARG